MIKTIREFLEVPGRDSIAAIYTALGTVSSQLADFKTGVQSVTQNLYALNTASSNRMRLMTDRIDALEKTVKALTEVEITILRRDGAYKLEKANPADACYDLFVREDTVIPAGEREAVDTGLVIAVPFNCEVQVRSRSGIAANKAKARNVVEVVDGVEISTGLEPFPKHLTIHLGTCDAGYRGEYKVIIENGNLHDVVLKRGDKIAQLAVRTIPSTTEKYVESEDELPASDGRGANGFNSSGTQARNNG